MFSDLKPLFRPKLLEAIDSVYVQRLINLINFSIQELQSLYRVRKYFIHFLNNLNEVFLKTFMTFITDYNRRIMKKTCCGNWILLSLERERR